MNMPRGNGATEASLAADGARAAVVTELQTRVASAVVLAPVALVALIAGGLPFAALVALVAAIGLWEWTGIASVKELPLRSAAAGIAAAGLMALQLVDRRWALGLLVVPTLLALVAGLRWRSPRWAGLGLIYVAVPSVGLVLLRQAEAPVGWAAVLFILVVVWATDVAAYFAGRGIGGPKLWPRVSPKKTWSGALGGAAAALVAGGLVVALSGIGSFITGAALAVPLSIAAQAGDLFESAVKRKFGVKDSGTIIPGHGGVLDRVDGLFGAAALAWLLAALGLGGGILMLPGVEGGL
jgi:phosphatidate cytidylyltransferase